MTVTIDEAREYLESQGYLHVRELPSGEFIWLGKFLTTWGVCLGSAAAPRTRFCYERRVDAEAAVLAWNGEGFPPGFWVKQKPEDIHGPGSAVPARLRELPPTVCGKAP